MGHYLKSMDRITEQWNAISKIQPPENLFCENLKELFPPFLFHPNESSGMPTCRCLPLERDAQPCGRNEGGKSNEISVVGDLHALGPTNDWYVILDCYSKSSDITRNNMLEYPK